MHSVTLSRPIVHEFVEDDFGQTRWISTRLNAEEIPFCRETIHSQLLLITPDEIWLRRIGFRTHLTSREPGQPIGVFSSSQFRRKIDTHEAEVPRWHHVDEEIVSRDGHGVETRTDRHVVKSISRIPRVKKLDNRPQEKLDVLTQRIPIIVQFVRVGQTNL